MMDRPETIFMFFNGWNAQLLVGGLQIDADQTHTENNNNQKYL